MQDAQLIVLSVLIIYPLYFLFSCYAISYVSIKMSLSLFQFQNEAGLASVLRAEASLDADISAYLQKQSRAAAGTSDSNKTSEADRQENEEEDENIWQF